MLLQKGFESRHEAGGFGPGIVKVFHNRDFYHVLGGDDRPSAVALLVFNVVTVLRKHLGHRGLRRHFFTTPLEEVEARQSGLEPSQPDWNICPREAELQHS